MIKSLIGIFLVLLSFSRPGFCGSSGHISIDQRIFKNDNISSSNDRGFAISTNLRPSLSWKGIEFSGNLLGRVDEQDSTRNVFILQEAMLRYKIGTWELFGGYEKFNLGALEVFKPSDNLNARNFDSDVENTEKYGELTYGVKKTFSFIEVSVFSLPGEEKHYIPGANSRLGVGIDVQDVEYIQNVPGEDNNNEFGVLANFFTDVGDFTLFYLNHLDKKLPIFGNKSYFFDPTQTICRALLCPSDNTLNTPYYYETEEWGGAASLVFSDLIVKLEGVSRNYNTSTDILTINGLERPENHTETALGLEYTQYLESGIEVRYLAEYSRVFGVDKSEAKKRFIFQNDLYLGVHVTLNDPMDTKFNVGGITDLSGKSEALYFVTFDRRLNSSWRVKSGLRYIDATSTGIYPQGLEIFEDDHQAYLNLTYYF